MTPAWLRRGPFQSGEHMLSSEYRWKRDQGKGSPMARLQRSSEEEEKKKKTNKTKRDFTQRTALLQRLDMVEFLEEQKYG